MHCILTTADATQTHKLRSVSELRSGKTKKKNGRTTLDFVCGPRFKEQQKSWELLIICWLIFFFGVQPNGSCHRTLLSPTHVPTRLPFVSYTHRRENTKKDHNSLQLFFAQTQNKKKKTIFTLTISIAHRNSILIFIFRSVLCCQWNWQYRALQHARTLSEISVHTVFVSPSLIN